MTFILQFCGAALLIAATPVVVALLIGTAYNLFFHARWRWLWLRGYCLGVCNTGHDWVFFRYSEGVSEVRCPVCERIAATYHKEEKA